MPDNQKEPQRVDVRKDDNPPREQKTHRALSPDAPDE